jgi:hypothetical protein
MCTLEDNTCTLAPYFKLKNAAKFKEIWQGDYANFAHKDDCVHYAFTFTEDDSRAHCREAYPDAEKLLQHIGDVGAVFHPNEGGCLHPEVAELERLEIHGPAAELEKLKEPLKELPVTYYTCEWGFRPSKEAMAEDTVVHLYPYFKLKDAVDFKKIWGDAYAATKAAAEEEHTHQYAFSFEGSNMASCRESYGDAAGILCHLGNVDGPLKAALDGPSDLDRLEVHGPAAELEKLKEALGPLGAQFFVTGWGFRNAIA